jgi:hypothetical protein
MQCHFVIFYHPAQVSWSVCCVASHWEDAIVMEFSLSKVVDSIFTIPFSFPWPPPPSPS